MTDGFDQIGAPIVRLMLLLGLLGFLVACTRKFISYLGVGIATMPQVRAVPLMTRAERDVIRHIEAALPGTRIHAQVSMGALMQPRRGLSRRLSTITRNRFSSKRVDFVAEDRRTGSIIAIIELDDWSHSVANDRWRDRLTASAGYRTIRLPAGEHHTAETVRARIQAALNR